MHITYVNNMIVSMSIDEDTLERFDRAIRRRGYSSRSEAMRDLMRDFIGTCEWEFGEGESIAIISLLYGKDMKKSELMRIQHRYREISTMLHTHIDPGNCLEVYVIKARVERIEGLLREFRGLQGIKVLKFMVSASEL